MTHDQLYDFLLLVAKVFPAFFVLGLHVILETYDDDDDDDDQDGGILQPCYATNQ